MIPQTIPVSQATNVVNNPTIIIISEERKSET